MLTEKDFYDYFAEETISIGFVSTQKPEEPIFNSKAVVERRGFRPKIFDDHRVYPPKIVVESGYRYYNNGEYRLSHVIP